MELVRVNINLERSSKSLSLVVPASLPKWFRVLRTGIKLGLLLFLVQTLVHFSHQYLVQAALDQRQELRKDLQKLDSRLLGLTAKLETSFDKEDLLYTKYGVASPDPEIRQLGRGGDVHPDSLFLWSMDPVRGMRSGVVERMEKIEAQIAHNQNSFTNLKNFMEQQFSHWRHTPSVAPTSGRFSSPFGYRTHPVTGERNKMHMGIDISNHRWTPIHASADGVVDLVKNQEYFGNYVVVNHGNGYVTKYGHMEKPIVRQGQMVKRYQVLGYMGRTGRTTGIHLHYEVWYNNEAVNPIGFVLSPEYAVE